MCSNCPCQNCNPVGSEVTLCPSALCKQNEGGTNVVASATYEPGQIISADISNGGLISPTTLPWTLCQTFTQPTLDENDINNLPDCGGVIPPQPGGSECIASPCTLTASTVISNHEFESGQVVGTAYQSGEAPYRAVSGQNVFAYLPYQSCGDVFTSPAAGLLWGDHIGVLSTCGSESLIYGGSGEVAASAGGSYPYRYNAGVRLDGRQTPVVLFWMWVMVAIVAGTGMMIL